MFYRFVKTRNGGKDREREKKKEREMENERGRERECRITRSRMAAVSEGRNRRESSIIWKRWRFQRG